jgi:nucleotidyltransferase substrate binding protein (TIGR01987 family)
MRGDKGLAAAMVSMAAIVSCSPDQAGLGRRALTALPTLKTMPPMSPSPIDLQPLRNALGVLQEAMAFWRAHEEGHALKRHLRSAVIQSFEFSYELSVRALRRVLIERASTATSVADLAFNDLLRLGADAGLLADPGRWRQWRELRNATSHAYDEAKAQAVVQEVPGFIDDAQSLLITLQAAVDAAR